MYYIGKSQMIIWLQYLIIKPILLSEAKAVIDGPSEMYIKAGSKLKLFCRYYNLTERPTAVFW